VVAEGFTIGTYRVLHKIGEGGMGVVYVAEHTLLGRKAAIKVLLPELSAHNEIVQRFFNEARAVTQIADPGIVQVFDFGYHEDGSAFIVMELLEGEPMDRRLARIGRFSPHDGLRLMRMICTSLQAAHVKGIIHRDLKPENIFLVGDAAVTGGERAKILDFGIAKLSRDEPGGVKTRTGAVMGTPVYMSPEQCRGTGEIDARSDIYSVVCVMMTMLTGRPPFEGSGSGELIVAHMTAAPPLASSRIPGLPPIIDQIFMQGLAKQPQQRFQSMAALAQALGQAEQVMFSPGAMPGTYPGYQPSGPTPPPQLAYAATPQTAPRFSGAPVTGPDLTSKPTTLGGAASQQATAPARGRRGLVVALGTIVLGAIVTVAIVASRGDERAGSPRAGSADSHAAGSGSADTHAASAGGAIAQPVPADASAAAVPTDAAEIATALDAAPGDAAGIAQLPVDAGHSVSKRPVSKVPKRGPGGNDHAQPTGSGSATSVDRGD
jgi:serine/threonine-protein kinase